jgi:hypothetical protein
MRRQGYVIYDIDDNKYWCGGKYWSYDAGDANIFDSIGEVEAAISGLYRRYSGYNLMYRRVTYS